MIIQELIDTTLVVDLVEDGLERGDVLEGGHRVVGVVSSCEIILYVNHPHNLSPGKSICKIGTLCHTPSTSLSSPGNKTSL